MNKIDTSSHRVLPNKQDRHRLFGSVEPGPKTKPTVKEEMADLQNTEKDFLFDIKEVGISNVKYPIVVQSLTAPMTQSTIGTLKLTAQVNRTSKGTNMSRFLEQIEQSNSNGFQVDFSSLLHFSEALKTRLEQEHVTVEISFPWFYERKGPSTGSAGLNHAEAAIKIDYEDRNQATFQAKLTAYITTLCPCSKEISEYSAHSQRGKVTMEVSFTEDFNDQEIDWKEALLHAAESNASAMIHPVLKRPDEKSVTETAYENPRFVEDIVRLVAADLYDLPFVKQFKVTCENEESIHLHDAVATIEFDKEIDR